MAFAVSDSIRQVLVEAAASSTPETVVIQVKGQTGAVPDPKETVRIAQRMVERVRAKHGYQPEKMNIFENLGSFVVRGDAALLLHLLDQPEVAGATLNRRVEVEPFRPVRKGPATSKGWVEIE